MVAFVLAAIATLCITSGVAMALHSSRPDLALIFAPWDARALARKADQSLLAPSPGKGEIAQARSSALAALSYDATLPNAWRNLSLTNAGGTKISAGLLRISESLSRRDVPTQLALIELKVEQGDIVAALRHYDIILRVSTAYDPVLFPVLAGAMTEQQVLMPFSDRLINAPMWRRRFLSYIVNGGAPLRAQEQLYTALAKRGGLIDRDIAAASATNAALGGDYDTGWHIYTLLFPKAAAHLLRDGNFQPDGIAPYTWQIDVDNPVQSSINGSGDKFWLEMASARGDGGRGARQLLKLPPGRYQLTAQTDPLDGDKAALPYLRLLCAGDGRVLAKTEDRGGVRSLQLQSQVPADCSYQWLELGLSLDPNGTATSTRITAVAVTAVKHS